MVKEGIKVIALMVGENEKSGNSLLCVVYDDKGVIEERPLGMMFRELILELQATENEETFNQFAEKIKDDLRMGIDLIERLQIPLVSNSTH